MTRSNIKVTEDVFEQHNETRKAKGLSWSEYMRRLEFEDGRDNEPEQDVSQPSQADVSGELTDIHNELEAIKSELKVLK
jgi:hypothetical protein